MLDPDLLKNKSYYMDFKLKLIKGNKAYNSYFMLKVHVVRLGFV